MIYTNGVYWIDGEIRKLKKFERSKFAKQHRRGIIEGIVVRSIYPNVYDVGDWIVVPLYHLYSDKKPQFVNERLKKLKRCLKL